MEAILVKQTILHFLFYNIVFLLSILLVPLVWIYAITIFALQQFFALQKFHTYMYIGVELRTSTPMYIFLILVAQVICAQNQ